jgi:hypothetical protein
LGRAGIEEYNKKAREYGVFSKEGAEAADELRRKQTDLTLAVEGLGYTIAEQLAPVLGPLLQSFASWIAQNRGLIGQDIAGWVTTISDDAKILKNHLDPVVDKFGGWNKVLTDLAPLIVLRLVPGVAALENALIRLAAVRIPTALLTVLGAPASVLAALAALGSYASYKGAKTSMDMAGIAANLGYTDVAQVDDAGNPVSVTNPKTGMTKSIQDFDISTHPNLVNPSAGPGATLGDRYNNPLDLKGAGTIGVDEKGFGIYKTRAEGVAAAENQLLRYQDEGLKTLGAMINKWAPASDGNDPTGYSHQVADAVSKSLHRTVGVDSQIDMRDPAVARAVVTAMAKRESGVTLSPEDANINPPANINGGTGASTPAPASPTVNGSVTVGVSFKNAPPGTTTTAAATGPIFGGPPKVEQSMPNNGLGGLY